MYIELSLRQSGKSSRLIAAVLDKIQTVTDPVAIIVNKESDVRRFTGKFIHIPNWRDKIKILTSYQSGHSVRGQKISALYIDEFDYFESLDYNALTAALIPQMSHNENIQDNIFLYSSLRVPIMRNKRVLCYLLLTGGNYYTYAKCDSCDIAHCFSNHIDPSLIKICLQQCHRQ